MAQEFYTPELADEILMRMANGESLRQICSGPGKPSAPLVRKWVVNDKDGFAQRYENARIAQGHAVAEKAYADAFNEPDPQKARLMFDAGRWYAGKLHPKAYSDKASVEHTGANGAALFPTLSVKVERE